MSELEAGKELNAAIARNVFGYTVEPAASGDAFVCHGACDCATREGVESITSGHFWWCWQPVPRYSQDIAVAWRVVDHLIALGWEPQVFYATTPPGPHWEAWLWQFEGEHPHVVTREEHHYNAATAPLAICLAALKASESQP